MKKLLYVTLILLFAASSFAAEGYVTSGVAEHGDGVRVVTIDFTLDDDGTTYTFEDAMVEALKGWSLYYVEIDPGATAPTAAYDMVINNTYGIDILGGAGANLSATASSKLELIYPMIDAASIVFSNNSQADALVDLRLVFYRSY